MTKIYYLLAKPGIVYGNAIAAAAGFFLASKGYIRFSLLVSMIIGISLVIASSCVFNNYIDRYIDKKMKRTKDRALATGLMPPYYAIIYAGILGVFGLTILALYTNALTVFLALIGMFFYIVMYGIWKRRSTYGTIIGSISGAVPLVVGYCAVTNRFDRGALLLFIILILWQMPHFYALAIYYIDDYTAAGLPILPIKKGLRVTKIHMVFYIIAFTIAASLLTIFKFTGYIYLTIILLVSFIWLGLVLKGFSTPNNKLWGQTIFRFSLIVLLTFCAMISLNIRW